MEDVKKPEEPVVETPVTEEKTPRATRGRGKEDGKGKKTVYAVYGEMVHLYTGERISISGTQIEEVDNWVQAQVDAGKLRVE